MCIIFQIHHPRHPRVQGIHPGTSMSNHHLVPHVPWTNLGSTRHRRDLWHVAHLSQCSFCSPRMQKYQHAMVLSRQQMLQAARKEKVTLTGFTKGIGSKECNEFINKTNYIIRKSIYIYIYIYIYTHTHTHTYIY